MARQTVIIGIVVVLIVVIIVGGIVVWQSGYFNPAASPSPSVTPSPTSTLMATLTPASPTPSSTPDDSTQVQVRDAVMTYIRTNHNETSQYMQTFNWTGGRVDTGLLGSVLYSYQSSGWNLTMRYPVVLDPLYTVTAEYTSQDTSNAKIISWLGSWQNSTISETSYNNTQLPLQEQVRNNVMDHLKSKYAETTPYMKSFNWTGGRVETGLVGSETYTYLSQGWNVTMQYPVIPDPLFTITADFTDGTANIAWKGTWQSANITDTSYISNINSLP